MQDLAHFLDSIPVRSCRCIRYFTSNKRLGILTSMCLQGSVGFRYRYVIPPGCPMCRLHSLTTSLVKTVACHAILCKVRYLKAMAKHAKRSTLLAVQLSFSCAMAQPEETGSHTRGPDSLTVALGAVMPCIFTVYHGYTTSGTLQECRHNARNMSRFDRLPQRVTLLSATALLGQLPRGVDLNSCSLARSRRWLTPGAPLRVDFRAPERPSTPGSLVSASSTW